MNIGVRTINGVLNKARFLFLDPTMGKSGEKLPESVNALKKLKVQLDEEIFQYVVGKVDQVNYSRPSHSFSLRRIIRRSAMTSFSEH